MTCECGNPRAPGRAACERCLRLEGAPRVRSTAVAPRRRSPTTPLALARAAKGLRVADVAAALGQSGATASKICSGAQRPDARQCQVIAALLGLDAWALMLRVGIVPPAVVQLLQRDPEASARALRELAGSVGQ